MSYTPWMRSLLNRMKELYNKPNAKTIAEALPELGSGGDVSPSSVARAIGEMTDTQKAQALDDLGGANVLTLYAGEKDGTSWAYKNQECTEVYGTYEEAYSALNDADVIIIIPPAGSPAFKIICVSCAAIIPGDDNGFVAVKVPNGNQAYLWTEANSPR